MARGNL